MSYGKRATWDTIREIAFGSLLGTYVAVGGVLTIAARAVKITNMTDQTVYFTDNGTDDKLKLPPNSYQLWDITTNKTLSDKPQFFEVGTQFSCRYDGAVAPTTNWVSVETLVVKSGS